MDTKISPEDSRFPKTLLRTQRQLYLALSTQAQAYFQKMIDPIQRA